MKHGAKLYTSLSNRNGNASNLALGYNITNFGVNFVSPMKNSDFILRMKLVFKTLIKIIKYIIRIFLLDYIIHRIKDYII